MRIHNHETGEEVVKDEAGADLTVVTFNDWIKCERCHRKLKFHTQIAKRELMFAIDAAHLALMERQDMAARVMESHRKGGQPGLPVCTTH